MRLVLDSDPKVYTVRHYAPGEILIGEQRLTRPCIVSAHRVITDWDVSTAAALSLEGLEPLLALQPAIVLLGALDVQQPLERTLRRSLQQRGIALEYMNLGAACRTYNILVQEERRVAAGLFPL
jgi:uncharacterized protein